MGNKYSHYSVLQRLRRDRDFVRRVTPRGSSRSRDHFRRAMSIDARPFIPSENINNENPSMPDITGGKCSIVAIIYFLSVF